MLIVFFLSIYMVVDRDAILAFLFRIVPPALLGGGAPARDVASRARSAASSAARRSSASIYFLVALATNLVLGLPLAALTSVAVGLLQTIPFFGPFVVLGAAGHRRPRPPSRDRSLPPIILMGAGWIVVMNVLQPRIMQGAVGIHPIVVLGSVLIGGRIAGHPGAIFGIPIAAVVSAFFLEFLHRTSGDRSRRRARGAPARGTRRPPGPDPARTGARQRHRHRRAGRTRRSTEPDAARAPT